MHAELFCWEERGELANLLQELIMEHLGHGVQVWPYVLKDCNDPTRFDLMNRYGELLHAAIPPETSRLKEVIVRGGSFVFLDPSYCRDYWPMYLPGLDPFPEEADLHRLFPALAIDDHMVLVPCGHIDFIRTHFGQGGSLKDAHFVEVDFRQCKELSNELDKKVAGIARKVRQDLCRELVALGHLQPGSVSPDNAAHLLNVSRDVADRVVHDEHASKALSFGHLSCTINPIWLPTGKEQEVTLTVRNESFYELTATMDLLGPDQSESRSRSYRAGRVKTFFEQVSSLERIPAGGERQEQILLTVLDPGPVPVEIDFALDQADPVLLVDWQWIESENCIY